VVASSQFDKTTPTTRKDKYMNEKTIRAFQVRVHGTTAITFALTASKARYAGFFAANDAGYKTTFADVSVKRAPDFDCRLFTDGKIPPVGKCYGREYLKVLPEN
jgi:hypothetical protein